MTKPLVTIVVAALLLASCANEKNKEATEAAGTAAKRQIELAEVAGSPDFPGARLTALPPKASPSGNDSVKLEFKFNVENYELKAQTGDNASKACNNSAQGQHIHFIMDNQPYKALYEPKNETVVAKNSEHTLMCFLSRSYHEALKSNTASVVQRFKIDEKGNFLKGAPLSEPTLFYSRPKGDYLGADTANILLDFYLVNCTLSDTGYYVQAKISNEANGIDTTVLITKWAPWFIKGLGTGQCKVELSLMHQKEAGKSYTNVSREFRLAAGEVK